MATLHVDMMNRLLGRNWCKAANFPTFSIQKEVAEEEIEKDVTGHLSAIKDVISAFNEVKIGGFLFFRVYLNDTRKESNQSGQASSSGSSDESLTKIAVYAIFMHPNIGIRSYRCFPLATVTPNSNNEMEQQMRSKIEQELSQYVQTSDAFNFVLNLSKKTSLERDLSKILSCALWIEALLEEITKSTFDSSAELLFQQAVSDIASSIFDHSQPLPCFKNDFRQISANMMNKVYGESWRSNTINESTVILPAILPREETSFQSAIRKAFDAAKIGGVLVTFARPLPQFYEELDIDLPDAIKVCMSNLSNTSSTTIDLTKVLLFLHPKLGFSWIIDDAYADHEQVAAQLNAEVICLARALQLTSWLVEGVQNRPYVAAMHFQGGCRHGQHVSYVAENFKEFLSNSQIDLSEKVDFQRFVASIVGIRTYRKDPLHLPEQFFLTAEQLAYTESIERIEVLHGESGCGKTSAILSKILKLRPILENAQVDICVFNEQDYEQMKAVAENLMTYKMMKPNVVFLSESFEKQAIAHVNATTAEFVFFDGVEAIPYKISKMFWMEKPKNMRVIGGIAKSLQHVTFAIKSRLRSGVQHPKRVFQWHCLSRTPEVEKEIVNDQSVAHSPEFIAKYLHALDNFYPNWQAGDFDRTIFLPSSLDINKNTLAKAELVPEQEHKKLLKEKEKKLYGKHSAEAGSAAEESFSQAYAQLKLGGVVILGFTTRDLLNRTKDAKLSQKQAKSLKNLVGHTTSEIDFLLCHPRIGIFVVEVKGAKEVFTGKTGPVAKAREQLDKNIGKKKDRNSSQNTDENIGLIPEMYKIFTGNECKIPISGAICFPFANVPENECIPDDWAFIDKSTIEDNIKFANFWKTLVEKAGKQNFFLCDSQEVSDFCQFIAAISGYLQAKYISMQFNALEIYRTLDKQSFLKPDKEKAKKNKSSATSDSNEHQPIEIVVDGMKQPFFLNTQQAKIMAQDHKRQIIYGPPGTGKSLLVYLLALDAAKKPSAGKILFQTRPSLLKNALKFFADNRDPEAMRSVTVVDGLFFNVLDNEADDCFLDECEFGRVNMNFYSRRSMRSGKTVIAITGGLRPTDFQATPQKLGQISAAYELTELKAVVRGTRNIIEYWAEEIPNYKVTIGHNCSGTIVDKTNEISRSDLLLQELHSQLQRFFPNGIMTGENVKFKPKHFAVITPDAIEAEKVRCYLACQGIECGSSEEQMKDKNESLIVVDQPDNVLSQEWPVVFAFSMLGIDYYPEFRLICASRAIAHLSVIERDYQSAYAAIQQHIDDTLGDQFLNTSLYKFGEVAEEAHKNMGEEDAQVIQFDALSIYFRTGYGAVGLNQFEPFEHCTTLTNVLQVIINTNFLLRFTILSTRNAMNTLNFFFIQRQSWAGNNAFVLRSEQRSETKFLDVLMQADGLREVYGRFMDAYCEILPIFASQILPNRYLSAGITEEETRVIEVFKDQAEWRNFIFALDLALNSSVLNSFELEH